eukprot:3815768-Rhodomonas_salina.1
MQIAPHGLVLPLSPFQHHPLVHRHPHLHLSQAERCLLRHMPRAPSAQALAGRRSTAKHGSRSREVGGRWEGGRRGGG